MRINFMQTDCYLNGVCTKCGCSTTALQMANKACDKPCYPIMMNKDDWKLFNEGYVHIDKTGRWGLKIHNILSHDSNKSEIEQYLVFYPKDQSQKQILLPTNKKLLTYVE